jgi:hypothetical protein
MSELELNGGFAIKHKEGVMWDEKKCLFEIENSKPLYPTAKHIEAGSKLYPQRALEEGEIMVLFWNESRVRSAGVPAFGLPSSHNI